jgi:hypothetical protein
MTTVPLPVQHQPHPTHNPITPADCEVITGLIELTALLTGEGDLCENHPNAKVFAEVPIASLHELQARAGHFGITPQLVPPGVEWVAERRINDRVSLRLTCLA